MSKNQPFILLIMSIMAVLFSFEAFSKVSNGELRQITKQFTNEHHPECKVLFRTSGSWTQVKGDVMVCSNRLISSFDRELNKLYKQVMDRYEIFPKKQNRIKKVQRNWIKHRDNKCIYIDKLDNSGFMKPKCHAMHLALSTWYLKRLNSIQFDEQGLPKINNVIKEYYQRLNNS
jgi:uncharacterized protein YecT (DUF1311 family)